MLDPQTIWSAALIVPAVVLALVAIPALRAGRTRLGLGLRNGAILEFLRGVLFSVPFLALLLLLIPLTGLSATSFSPPDVPRVVEITIYFLVLMLVEEIVSAPC